METDKKIEILKLKAKDIKFGFGNPRKITNKNKEKLEKSLNKFGDFGCFVIDENNNILAGNQRVKIIQKIDPEREVLCKKLIGYTETEKRVINIKANQHEGEFDEEKLADWVADLNLDCEIEIEDKKDIIEEKEIKEMELIAHEKYDYVMIACKTDADFIYLTNKLHIAGKVCKCGPRKIKARAVWLDQISDYLFGEEGKKEIEDIKNKIDNEKVDL